MAAPRDRRAAAGAGRGGGPAEAGAGPAPPGAGPGQRAPAPRRSGPVAPGGGARCAALAGVDPVGAGRGQLRGGGVPQPRRRRPRRAARRHDPGGRGLRGRGPPAASRHRRGTRRARHGAGAGRLVRTPPRRCGGGLVAGGVVGARQRGRRGHRGSGRALAPGPAPLGGGLALVAAASVLAGAMLARKPAERHVAIVFGVGSGLLEVAALGLVFASPPIQDAASAAGPAAALAAMALAPALARVWRNLPGGRVALDGLAVIAAGTLLASGGTLLAAEWSSWALLAAVAV